MIDHISLTVRDLAGCAKFYEAVLATIGYAKLVARPDAVGFGKKYPELWLNHRPAAAPVSAETGAHVALRAPSTEAVDAFHRAALAGGGTSDGAPGLRPEYSGAYYACFVRDPEGHRVEAVTFLRGEGRP